MINRGLRMKLGNIAFLSDCSEKKSETIPVRAQLLKCIVEAHYGGTARFVQPVWVRTTLKHDNLWEGVVYIFDLCSSPERERAYAWSNTRSNGKPRYFTALHRGSVNSPKEAVRAAAMEL